MRNKLFILMTILFLTSADAYNSMTLYASDFTKVVEKKTTTTTELNEQKSVEEIFKERNLDLSSKSALGWVRVLNSKEKRAEYKLSDLKDSEVIYLTAQLKTISSFRNTTFEGKLK